MFLGELFFIGGYRKRTVKRECRPTRARRRGADIKRNAECGIFIVAEHVRTYDAFQLRIEVGEEIGVAEQHPIEEKDIVELHAVKHDKKPQEKPREAEAVFYAVESGEGKRAEKEKDREGDDDPADGVGAAEAFLFIGDRRQIFLGRGGEKALILNEADAAVKQEKVADHDHEERKERYFHLVLTSGMVDGAPDEA